MRAAVLREVGSAPVAGEFDDPPAPGDGQVLLAVEAAGLNPADLALASGTYYVPTPPVPYVPGIEAVGRVVASGDPAFAEGARLYVDLPAVPHGTLAQRTLAWTASAGVVPDDLDAGVACALGVAGLAAWLCLEHRAATQPGETVLVLGASGAVGQFAVQIAKLLGAGRVVAAGRSEDSLARAVELGADAAVRLDGRSVPELTEAFREAAEGDVHVVVDPLCGEPALAALESLALGGRLVQMGRSASETMEMPSATVRGRLLSILGHTNVFTPADVKREAYARMTRHALAGELRMEVERVPLAEVAAAWERQASSPGRKLVVIP
jgi:NADPH2:quinone reductase